jgi:Fe-S cluster biogenesis protein NfuA
LDDRAAHEQVGRVEGLLDEVDELDDPAGRALATELARGLARILAAVRDGGDRALPAALVDDELVAHLLILHDLHPVPVEARVHAALEKVRPYLDSHGGNVELLDVDEGVVRLRLEGSCSGCPSSAMTLKNAIEAEIHKAAPEIEDIEAEGATTELKPALLQIEVSETLSCPAVGGTGASDVAASGAAR